MTKFFFCIVLTIFCAAIVNFSQDKVSPTPTPQSGAEDVIRISSKLVLVDALVLNKEGSQVTNLTSDDFEIYQDGKAQEITNFSYISGEKGTLAQKSDNKSVPLPPINVRSGQGRVITFVLDDGNCLATPEGLAIARDGMKKFISDQMLANDKVAIYRTRGGSSLLQMYTSNKEVLRRIINKVNWFPSNCGSAFDSTRNDSTAKIITGEGNKTFDSAADKGFKSDVANNERTNQVKSSFGVLGFLIDRLKILPQRKIVFFISEGIPINPRDISVTEALRGIADKASRASVVFYTMSEKGLTNPGMIEARDEVGGDGVVNARIEEERSLNNGLAYLAYQTGGKFIRNKNFLETDINKILETESGYYLLGYQPADDTFKGKEFHRIEIKLKRDDLKISSRKGFYGRDEKESRPKYKDTNSPLYQAIASPFQEDGINIRLTTLTGNNIKEGNYIRALFHISGQDLTFTNESNGMKKVILDVVAVMMDEKGKVVEEFNRTYPISITEKGIETVKQNGLDYSTDIPVKNPGFYNFRLAVRDEHSNRLASAGDFVEILNPKKDKFFTIGLLTTGITKDGKPLLPKLRTAEAAFAPVFTATIPSIRQYKAGLPFAYIYDIYNPELDKATSRPKLTTQFRIFKDGKLLAEGKETPVEFENQTDFSMIQDYGFLKLHEDAEVGEYILQLIVKDTLANKNSTQWIDFEVVK